MTRTTELPAYLRADDTTRVAGPLPGGNPHRCWADRVAGRDDTDRDCGEVASTAIGLCTRHHLEIFGPSPATQSAA